MFSSRSKCDMLANNISESFNQYIKDARDKPIITMLEMIRRQFMSRFEEKRSWIATCTGLLCPKIKAILESLKSEVRNSDVTYAGNSIYEVRMGTKTFVVDLANHTCSCRKWDVTGIPCTHGIAAIMVDKRQPENFVNECYHIETYVRTYSSIINPIPDQSMWIHTDVDAIMPPPLRRPPGRPKKARKKGPDEVKNTDVVRKTHGTLKCGNCQQYGHNTRTCKGAPPKARGIGRRRGRGRSRGMGRGRATVRAATSQTSGITLDTSRPITGMTSIMWDTLQRQNAEKGKGIATTSTTASRRGRGRGRGRGGATGLSQASSNMPLFGLSQASSSITPSGLSQTSANGPASGSQHTFEYAAF